MIDVKRFTAEIERFRRLRPGYISDFDAFWLWKTSLGSKAQRPLDDDHIEEAYRRLQRILRRWQHGRGSGNDHHWVTFRQSLSSISGPLNEIRNCTLLELKGLPDDVLKCLWHGLGRVKQPRGDSNPSGSYLVISVCKPLMLLWGQTVAFDRNVRGALPARYGVSASHNRWSFAKWKGALRGLRDELAENLELCELIRAMSSTLYGASSVVPYGRFLDMYYWSVGSHS